MKKHVRMIIMKRIKVLVCFGTRPEAIKMAPLVKTLKKHDMIECVVCVTAQHRQMLDQVLELFDIKPDYDLDIMKENQTITHITGSVLEGVSGVLRKEGPDIILVHGDTTTTFASALAGFYEKVTVGHVEAGLRTDNKYSPYPEEMNRRLTSAISDLHFAPTPSNKANLIKENIVADNIFITGNTAIDALFMSVKADYVFEEESLNSIDYKSKKVIAMTAHRRENLGTGMESIMRAVKKTVLLNPGVQIVYPVHLNPIIREIAARILGDVPGITLTGPVNVFDMHNLMARAYFVMTDSGGLQEEAPSLGKPVLVMRTETERPEAVLAGTVKVVGVDENDIFNEAKRLINDKSAYDLMANSVNPYGDGNASQRILNALLYFYGIIGEKPKDWKVFDA